MPDLGCSPSSVVAYDYLVDKGLRDFQAAAIVGNLQQESGLNPKADVPDPVERSRGIAQWQPPRWQNLLAFAAGRDPWAFDVQLEFLWHELQTTPYLGLDALSASTTLENAVVAFQDRFERCKTCHTSKRIEYANAVLFACPRIRKPEPLKRSGALAVAAGVFALMAAAGYGIYKTTKRLTPFRAPRRPDLHPDFDYRSRL